MIKIALSRLCPSSCSCELKAKQKLLYSLHSKTRANLGEVRSEQGTGYVQGWGKFCGRESSRASVEWGVRWDQSADNLHLKVLSHKIVFDAQALEGVRGPGTGPVGELMVLSGTCLGSRRMEEGSPTASFFLTSLSLWLPSRGRF